MPSADEHHGYQLADSRTVLRPFRRTDCGNKRQTTTQDGRRITRLACKVRDLEMVPDAHRLQCFLERFVPEQVKHYRGFGIDSISRPSDYGVSVLVSRSELAFGVVC